MNQIESMLEALAQLKAQIDARKLAMDAAIAAIEAPIRPQIMAVEARFEAEVADFEQAAAELEAAIKAAVLTHGASVKGAHLLAVYSKGRATWDGKGLDGYAVAYPEVLKFRSVGEPSVSIRAAK